MCGQLVVKATKIPGGLLDPYPTITAPFYRGGQEKQSTTVVNVFAYNFLYFGQLEYNMLRRDFSKASTIPFVSCSVALESMYSQTFENHKYYFEGRLCLCKPARGTFLVAFKSKQKYLQPAIHLSCPSTQLDSTFGQELVVLNTTPSIFGEFR